MATTFYATEPVNAKPQHTGTVIYADNTCVRVLSSELLGGGGGVEIVAPFFMLAGIIFGLGNGSLTMFLSFVIPSIALLLLPMLLFRYKPNYPIFSRKSQEIYYVKSPKNIIKFNWAELKADYRRVSVFTGSAVSRIDTLTLIGTSQYGDKPPQPAVIAFVVTDEENAKELWAYFQQYMKEGKIGSEKLYYDVVKRGFIPEAKRVTKQAFYTTPMEIIEAVFSPKSKNPIWLRMLILPLAILFIPIGYIFIWPGQIATALVAATRKCAPIPDDILPNITDNPESWGKNPS